MAFAGVISDLFNCGRPRRPQTRDGAVKPGEDATRMKAVTQDPEPSIHNDAIQHNDSERPPIHRLSLGDALQPVSEEGHWDVTPLESTAPFNSRPSTRRPSIEDSADNNLKDAPEEEPQQPVRRNGPSHSKAKASIGKQIEQRFLVTIDTPSASNATPKLSRDNEVTPTDTAPVVLEASKVGAKDSQIEHVENVSTPHVETEPKLSQEHPAVPEPVSMPPSPEVEPVTPIQEVQPTFELKEVSNATALVEAEVPVVPITQAAPTKFLDLPTEIRGFIYERMAEENPIRVCRHDDPALKRTEAEAPPTQKRQFYNLTQVCRTLRKEFLPVYEARTEYIIDLWTQRANLPDIGSLKGKVAIDIDAACFDMQPIDILPLIRYLARTRKSGCRFASTEGVVFRSIEAIVVQLNKLLPSSDGSSNNWLAAVNGPMKRVDLHLFPHEDIRQYYRFRGAEPMLRIVYPSAATEAWMKQSHKCGAEYEAYLQKSGLDVLEMHVVVGHASRRTTNEGRMPLNWRLSYVGSRLSIDQAARISGTWTR